MQQECAHIVKVFGANNMGGCDNNVGAALIAMWERCRRTTWERASISDVEPAFKNNVESASKNNLITVWDCPISM